MRRFCAVVLAVCAVSLCAASSAGERRHDPLPLRYADLHRYDAIALEPYKDSYDRMPLHEKAKVYARAFAFMHDREPRFSPAVLERVRRSEAAAVTARSTGDARELLYRPPAPRRQEPPPDPDEALLSAIPMPWANEPSAPEETEEQELSGEAETGPDHRMESMRPGSLRIARPGGTGGNE